MRILLWPTYSYPGNIQADSLYLIARNLIRENPGFYWYLVTPQWAEKDGSDDLDEMTNVSKVDTEMPVLYRAQEAIPDRMIVEMFAPHDGLLPVEAVISMSPQRLPNLVNYWTIRSTETAEPVFVNWDLLARDDKSGEMTADEVELMQLAMGAACADLNIYESPMVRMMTLDMARKHVSSARVSRILESSVYVWQGVPIDRLSEGEVQKRDRFTVYYGGRLSESKRFSDLSEVVKKMYEFGRDVDFVITTGSIEGLKHKELMEAFPFAEIHVGKSQEEAWKIMRSCHTSLCFSSHELFGMAFWEQIAAGLPVVMKSAKWMEGLLPQKYPWLAQSNLEAAAMLRGQYEFWKMGSWAEVIDQQVDAIAHVYKHMDTEQNLTKLARMIEAQIRVRRATAFQAYEAGGRSGLSDLVDVVLEGKTEITLSELVEAVRGGSRIGKSVIGKKLVWAKSNAMLDLYRMMLWKGWTDTISSIEPTFVKGG